MQNHWMSWVAFILPSSWRLSPLVGWSHVDNLHKIFIPRCWINNGQMCDIYAFMQKVLLFPLPFYLWILFGWFGIISNQGIENWALGDFYWWSTSVETIKQVSKIPFLSSAFFCVEIIFFTEDQQGLHLDCTNLRRVLGIVSGKPNGDNITCLWINASPYCGTITKPWIQLQNQRTKLDLNCFYWLSQSLDCIQAFLPEGHDG